MNNNICHCNICIKIIVSVTLLCTVAFIKKMADLLNVVAIKTGIRTTYLLHTYHTTVKQLIRQFQIPKCIIFLLFETVLYVVMGKTVETQKI